MAKYYKRPDGLYETSRTINGKRVKFRGHSCAEVDRKILDYNTEMKKGRKFPVIADAWLAETELAVSQATYKVYGIAKKRLAEYFTGYAGEIKPIDCKRYINQLERKGYAKQTVQIGLGVLKQIFSYAVMQGDIDFSPATEVKISRGLPSKKRNALTEEQEIAVDSCRSGDWWLLGLMLLYTGCRRGELLALNWQDIDRAAGVIHVTKKLNYSFGNTPHLENHLKSENGKRDIPLLAPLAAALPQRRIGKIFTNEDGDYLTASQLDRAWKSYCRTVGFTEWTHDDDGNPREKFPITPHCFRHSFTTICFEAGIDAKSTAAFLGDTEDITRKVYTDLRKNHHASSAEKVNAYLAMRSGVAEG